MKEAGARQKAVHLVAVGLAVATAASVAAPTAAAPSYAAASAKPNHLPRWEPPKGWRP